MNYTETGDGTEVSSLQDGAFASGRTMEDLLGYVGGSGVSVLGNQIGESFLGTAESRSFRMGSRNCDLGGSLDVYFTYRTTDSGIEVYANYQNYMETPFVELRDGLEYPVVKDRTFLKLSPGESGDLDCLVQLRYTYGGVLRGVRDVVLATYRIFNVSDDKPKIVIWRMYTLRKDSLSDIAVGNRVNVSIGDVSIDTARVLRGETEFPAYVLVQTPRKLKVPYEIGVFYPQELLSCDTGFQNYYSKIDASIPGYARITITSRNNVQVKIPFRTVDGIDLHNRTVRYTSFSENDVFAEDGTGMDVTYNQGNVKIANPAYPILVTGVEESGSGTNVSAYVESYRNSGSGGVGTYFNPT